MKEFPKIFDFKSEEPKLYRAWEKSGYFNPDKFPKKRSRKPGAKGSNFCIIMPPPNANGSLHLGHAVGITLQDILTRFYRMRGRKALWLPGADHAGFETQVVFDKKLEKEGRNRFQIPRDELYREIWNFTQENKKTMESQMRRIGASCDWSRKKFTLDKDIVEGTYDTFIALYKDGLVYRGARIVNWCPRHRTSLSDLEVTHKTQKDPLYYIRYGPLTLATVRPETKFGDTALAVNPKDERYKKYIGKEIEAKGILGLSKFKVIADSAVDASFGTGVVKVTPAHDEMDFAIWTRHKHEIPGPKVVIDESGRLTREAGPFAGMKVMEAREKIAEEMQKIGILEKIDRNYTHQVAVCYKCGSALEPLPKTQWWVKTKPLAEKAIDAVKSGAIHIQPAFQKKIYFHWLKNIKDWNISRQIVWGIRIPAWICGSCGSAEVAKKQPEKCAHCGHGALTQDPDVFDTWFSSGQWPFLTLGYPKKKDYKTFYPTSVLETGYDILFFWVARMVMLGLYRTGKVPFSSVYLHGMIRVNGVKMSKSKGNMIDPLAVADTYGTDALRMALVIGASAGQDISASEEKIRGYRNFVTKIWNVARFVVMHYDKELFNAAKPKLTAKDKKTLREFEAVKAKVARAIEAHKFHEAGETAYHYFWHTFADKIIESAKPRLTGEDLDGKRAAFALVFTILLRSLKVLHPFMPFITEAVYQKLLSLGYKWGEMEEKSALLMASSWD